jgi:hypothetical protein
VVQIFPEDTREIMRGVGCSIDRISGEESTFASNFRIVLFIRAITTCLHRTGSMRSVSNSGIQSDEKGTQKKKFVFKSAKLGYFFVISFLNFAKKDKN